MSLYPIAERIEIAPAPGPDRPASLALVFLLDAAYLDAFRVFALSLAATGSFSRDPVIVLSPDSELLADPFIKRICDLPMHIGPAEIARFAKVRSGEIDARFRLPWIAKFTFLKWLAYRNFGFAWHLIFDTDMLALRSLEPFAAAAGDNQFICCPKFPARPAPGRLVRTWHKLNLGDPSAEFRFLRAFLEKPHSIEASTRINSGIQLAGPKFLTGDFAEELLAIASAADYPNEQAVLTHYFRKSDGKGLAFRSPAYNFKAPSLAGLGTRQANLLLPRIANLHFLGARKPWHARSAPQLDLPASLWWRQAASMTRHADLFAAHELAAQAEAMAPAVFPHSGGAAAIIPGPALPPD